MAEWQILRDITLQKITASILGFVRLLEMEEGTKSAVYLMLSRGDHVYGGFDV